MQLPLHALNWFEIPVSNFDRAKKFYETLFDYQMPESMMGPNRMGFFLYDFQNGGRGGAIVYNPDFYTPSSSGSLIYFNCDPDLQQVLDMVENAGGKIVIPKTPVGPDLGYWALMLDTEENRAALHSMK